MRTSGKSVKSSSGTSAEDEAVDVIEVRSDLNDFSTVGEALDEALLRANGGAIFIHSKDDSQEHNLEDGEACFCRPTRIESQRLK
jgi:hypothetical protein